MAKCSLSLNPHCIYRSQDRRIDSHAPRSSSDPGQRAPVVLARKTCPDPAVSQIDNKRLHPLKTVTVGAGKDQPAFWSCGQISPQRNPAPANYRISG